MRQPISFIYRNLVFGTGPNDPWAVYRLSTHPYVGLPRGTKLELLARMAALVGAAGSDFSILRVARPWSLDHYTMAMEASTDVRHAHRAALARYLRAQREALTGRMSNTPEVYISVRLPRASWTRAPTRPAPLDRLPGVRVRRSISARRLERVLAEESRVHRRLTRLLECKRASARELQWLTRRAFSRGLGDPLVDDRFEPQALVRYPGRGEETSVRFHPLEVDVLRLFDSPIEMESRSLRIESELGESRQAFLCLGALPESVDFPSPQAELLFAPLEAVSFPVDAAFSARYLQADDSRLVATSDDADSGFRRREDRGRLLRASISLCVSATNPDELEKRVTRIRREYAAVALHRPLGEQLRLFVSHLPGQPSRVRGYESYLTADRFGAMVPVATHAVGTEVGPCIGRSLTGAPRPVLFEPSGATLLTGRRGSGKSLCLQLVAYQAFLRGSTVCSVDPGGGHALHRAPEVADHAEVLDLSASEHPRGLLDPLRLAPPELREHAARDFLLCLMPAPLALAAAGDVARAVDRVAARPARGCMDVVDELAEGRAVARDAARLLRSVADTGLGRLAFATAPERLRDDEPQQWTVLRAAGLTPPSPGARRESLSFPERLGEALQRLLALYGLRLASRDPDRRAILALDDAWPLLSDPAGRRLLEHLLREARERNVTVMFSTPVLAELAVLQSRFDSAFCFGLDTDSQAHQVVRLLGLDPDDPQLVHSLRSLARGRCLMRDRSGRASLVRIDPLAADLLTWLR